MTYWLKSSDTCWKKLTASNVSNCYARRLGRHLTEVGEPDCGRRARAERGGRLGRKVWAAPKTSRVGESRERGEEEVQCVVLAPGGRSRSQTLSKG